MPATSPVIRSRALRFAEKRQGRQRQRQVIARRSIAFGETPEESDTLTAAEFETLAKLLAHEIIYGKERPGVRVHMAARATVPMDPDLNGAFVLQPNRWSVPQSCFLRLQRDWMLARLVAMPTSLHSRTEFAVEPTELAKLALQHTKSLRERVAEIIAEDRSAGGAL